MLQNVVTGLLNPALELLSETLLQTPRPSTMPRLAELWGLSWQITAAVYGLLILVGGVLVMAHQSMQTRVGVREVLPRLAVGFLAGWLTLPLADMAVGIANAISDQLVGGVDERAGMAGLAELVRASLSSPLPRVGAVLPWPLLLAATGVWLLLIGVLCGYVVRVVALVVLVAAGPLVVMWHALPHTDPLARWWWRALAGLLSIQIIQALVVAVGLVVVLPAPGGPGAPTTVLGLPANGATWLTLLVVAVLLWVLLRVPGWVWSSVKISAGGRSAVTKLAMAALLYKTGGLVGGAMAGRTALGRGGGRRRLPAGWGDVRDPYESAPMEVNGQWQIPLGTLRRRRSRAKQEPWITPRGAEGAPRPGPGQLALPLEEGLWPQDRPVVTRGGQWRLPIEVTRVPVPPPPDPPEGSRPEPGPAPPRPQRPRQMQFPGYRGRAQLRGVGPVDPRRWYWPQDRPRRGEPIPPHQEALFSARRTPPPAPPGEVHEPTQLELDFPPAHGYQHRLRFTDPRRPLPERPTPFTAPPVSPARPHPTPPPPPPAPTPPPPGRSPRGRAQPYQYRFRLYPPPRRAAPPDQRPEPGGES